jgi:ankyrin repeat protein
MLHLAVGAGADSNSVDVDGSASLMWAAYLGDTGVVKMLLDAGTDTLLRGYDGKLARPFTIDRGDENVVLPI